MKITKRIIIVVLSMAVVISGLYWTAPKNTKADGDFAITAPKNGSLKAAGYMDIEWQDASSINLVDNYSVFVDGKLEGTTTDTKYEFYTTKVNFHRVWVRANFKDGTNHYTKTINFAITKKGLAVETNMGSNNIDPHAMGLGWYYNWGRGAYSGKYRDLEYVPMVWGDTNVATIRNKVQAAINAKSKYILGFNEPDMGWEGGGCNMETSTAIGLWPNFTDFKDKIKICSPAYAIWGANSKMVQFMAGVNNDVDVVCLHCYPADWNGGKAMADWFLEKVVDDAWNRYHKPIWITEYSTSGNGITQAGTSSFIENLLPGLDEREYVERQSFFSFNSATFGGGLYNYSTGELSESGKAYAKYGNPEEYYKNGDEVNPRDSEDPTEEPFTEATTTPSPTVNPTVKPTVKPTSKVKKPAKVKIKKAKYKKKRKIYIKFKKVSGANGYQIRYSDEKNFDGYWQKNTKKTKITLKKLDKNTKYYIKARAYKLVNGAKLFGKWSKKKKVKVKK